mmetsp:Transcript_12851/g.35480  ORF Transcript_12851/g.35480 Transcript_12851/m.35480 type:complete len:208 (-) Transcript_12851:120-743(-)
MIRAHCVGRMLRRSSRRIRLFRHLQSTDFELFRRGIVLSTFDDHARCGADMGFVLDVLLDGFVGDVVMQEDLIVEHVDEEAIGILDEQELPFGVDPVEPELLQEGILAELFLTARADDIQNPQLDMRFVVDSAIAAVVKVFLDRIDLLRLLFIDELGIILGNEIAELHELHEVGRRDAIVHDVDALALHWQRGAKSNSQRTMPGCFP